MKLILRSLACLAVLASTSGALRAADGVTMSQRVTTDGAAQTMQVQLTKDKMRAETGTTGNRQVIIFDAAKSVVSIVNVDRRTYSELTKAQIDQMAGMMQGMMAQMEAAMANMSPAQRAQMEAAMGGRGMGMGAQATPAKLEYRKTGVDRVGQWTCDKYEGMANGQKVSDICTVNPTALGLTAADSAVMTQLTDLFKGMAAMTSQLGGILNISARPEDQGYTGMPIRSSTTVMGKTTTSELTAVTRGDIPDAQFEVPAGFQKQDIMSGMGGMGGRGRQ